MKNNNFFAASLAFKNLRKNFVMFSASLIISVSCLLLLGSAILMVLNINVFVKNLQDQNEIVLFIEESFNQKQIDGMETELLRIPNVSSVKFSSKEQELQEYINSLGTDDPELVKSLLNDNPLRNAFYVKLDDLKLYGETIDEIKQVNGIANIRESKEIVDKILNIKDALTIISVWVICIFIFLALFIISNTVRLAMFTRKLEISIMKYVGATDSFIKRPFLFEGLFIGLLAGLTSFAIECYVYTYALKPVLAAMNVFQPIALGGYWIYMIAAFVAAGIFIGVVGSVLPMRKYLNV